VLLRRALTFAKLNKTEDALTDFAKVISIEPENESAYYNRANLYYHLGKYDLAIADYDQVIRLNPDNANAYYIKSIACSQMTQFAESHSAYQLYSNYCKSQ
jgi:tetratricopeptide (TPR) repeat protein